MKNMPQGEVSHAPFCVELAPVAVAEVLRLGVGHRVRLSAASADRNIAQAEAGRFEDPLDLLRVLLICAVSEADTDMTIQYSTKTSPVGWEATPLGERGLPPAFPCWLAEAVKLLICTTRAGEPLSQICGVSPSHPMQWRNWCTDEAPKSDTNAYEGEQNEHRHRVLQAGSNRQLRAARSPPTSWCRLAPPSTAPSHRWHGSIAYHIPTL
eukprot:6177234-Pleurochrysis_carterae.AAC.1